MKNINLIPTDKPSRLHNKNGELGNYPSTKLYIEDFKGNQHNSFHIYITSDEENKEGSIVLSTYDNWENESKLKPVTGKIIKITEDGYLIQYYSEHFGVTQSMWDKGHSKTIILTTDGDLINDGVQAIDDEFLEWFVKNPSCEEIEIDIDFDVIVTRTKSLLQNQSGKTIVIPHRIHYRIIIPKEELKQIKCYCGHTTYCDCGPLEEPKDVVLGYKTSIVAQMLDRIDLEEPKQETLEEAAERYLDSPLPHSYKRAVEFGAKWQQEQILQFLYSEITERRPYSSSKMCEKVIEFIEQLNTKK